MQTYPSMTSVNSMLSAGYLPPGHGYVPKKVKPDKPYGPSFVSVMNRTWRGPGQKYINYALVTFCFFILFILASGLYIGHRNVSRLKVLRTEVFGAMFVVIAILLCWLMFHFIYKARVESNKWRAAVRFRAEGLFVAAAYNPVYNPEDEIKLQTGTYGRKALREIPKPKKGKGGRSRAASRSHQAGGLERGIFEKKGPPPPSGQYPPPQGQYPPPQGQYPPPQGQYPPPQGQYPPPQGQYPPPQGQYPPPQGQYPPPQGQYPPPQGPPVEGMYAQVHKKPRPGEKSSLMHATSESEL